jgi:WD40 repeat protein
VAFSPDGCRVVSGSRDSTVRLWDTQNGREIAVLRADDWVKSVAFSTDGRWVVSRDWFDDKSQVWNAESGHRLGDAADVPSPWVEVPISGGWRANFGDRQYDYDFTLEGIHNLWVSRVCECPRRQDETNFTPATGGPPLAWFPDALKIITVHSDGLHWAGSGRFTNHLVLLRLEGG